MSWRFLTGVLAVILVAFAGSTAVTHSADPTPVASPKAMLTEPVRRVDIRNLPPAKPSDVAFDPSLQPHVQDEPSGALAPPNIAAVYKDLTPTEPGGFTVEAVGTGFTALADFQNANVTGFHVFPPDPQIAVGPTRVFEVVNIIGAIAYDKTDTGHTDGSPFSLTSFFGHPAGFSDYSPSAFYDDESGRFFMSVAASNSALGQSLISVAVSADSFGVLWNVYTVTSPLSMSFQRLGVSSDKVIATVNTFAPFGCTTNCTVTNSYWVFQKSDMVSGLSAARSAYTQRACPGAPSTDCYLAIQPARALSPTSVAFMAGLKTNVAGTLTIFSVTGTPAEGSLSVTEANIQVQTTNTPPPASQGGAYPLIATNDRRMLDASWRNGVLWLAGNAACPNDLTLACLRVISMNTASMTKNADGFLGGGPGVHEYYPAVTIYPDGSPVFVFTRSSSTEQPSPRTFTFPNGVAQSVPTTLLRNGGPYTQGPAPQRWGDYQAISLDPSKPTDAWAVVEFGQGDDWATFIAQISQDIDPSVLVLPLPSSDLIWDPGTARIYASIPETAPSGANSLVAIDPTTGQLGTPIAIGNGPARLARSDDGQYLYIGLNDEFAVRRFNLGTQLPEIRIDLGGFFAQDMVVLPGSPNSVVVSRGTSLSPSNVGVVVYDENVPRPQSVPWPTFTNVIEPSSSSDIIYGYNSEVSSNEFRVLKVSPSGISVIITVEEAIDNATDISFSSGRIYASNGQIFDPVSLSLVGRLACCQEIVVPDGASNRVYGLHSGLLKTYDSNTGLEIASLAIPGINGKPSSLIRWGSNGLAFRTSSNQVFIIHVPPLSPPRAQPKPPVQGPIMVANLQTNDLIWDRSSFKIYASAPSSGAVAPNSIFAIDPITGIPGASIYVGSEPHKLARSDDGHFLYVGLDGAGAIARVDLNSHSVDLQYSLGNDVNGNGEAYFPQDIVPLQGASHSVAVARKFGRGVAVYDDGVRRPNDVGEFGGVLALERSGYANQLYCINVYFAMSNMYIDDNGISFPCEGPRGGTPLFGTDLAYASGTIFGNSGQYRRSEIGEIVSNTLPGFDYGPIVADRPGNRLFTLSNKTILAFDTITFQQIGSLPIPGIDGIPTSLIRFGSDGLAFRTNAGQVFLIHSTLVGPSSPTPTPTRTPGPPPNPPTFAGTPVVQTTPFHESTPQPRATAIVQGGSDNGRPPLFPTPDLSGP